MSEESTLVPEIVGCELVGTFSPGEISQVWGMAVGGLRNMVVFGAMLLEQENSFCTRAKTGKLAGGFGAGDGLKAWLESNCPDVNYHTAMRFKRLAEAAIAHLIEAGINVTPRLIPQMAGILPPPENPPEDFDQGREALVALVTGKSQRDLLGAAYRPAGRPKGTPGGGRRAFTAEERTTQAMDEVKERLNQLAAFCVGPKLLALPEEYRLRVATTLKDLSNTFREGRPWAQ